MSKESLIHLTNNLYRLTLLFPKKEPLRYKIREVANDILANYLKLNFVLEQKENFLNELEENEFFEPEKTELNNNSQKKINKIHVSLNILDGFLEVALIQNWVSPSEILAIKKEYDNLAARLKELERKEKVEENLETSNHPRMFTPFEAKKEAAPVKNENQEFISPINQRQEIILDFLRQNNKVQVWQIKEIMPDVTKRTLRRDFEQMLRQGLIQRKGEKNETFYEIKAD